MWLVYQLVLVIGTLWYPVLCQSVGSQTGSIFMPYYTPHKDDDYVCTAQKVESVFDLTIPGTDQQSWITAFRASTSPGRVHHMLLMLCDDLLPGNQVNTSWECGHHGVCGNSHIIFGWAKNAAPTVLPPDVGFKVGGHTSSRYLVLQVHYAHPLPTPDNSGFYMSYTSAPQKFQAGIYLLVSLGYIPAKKPVWHLDVNCRLSGNSTIYPFAFRAHAHSLGTVITGYRYSYKNQSLAEIARGNPQWPQAFYPVGYLTSVRPGDLLHARCTYNSTSRDRVTYIGSTSNDEMCNLYLMYYVDAALGEAAFVCGQEEVPELTANLPEDSDHPLSPNRQLEQTASSVTSTQTEQQQPSALSIGKYHDQIMSRDEGQLGSESGQSVAEGQPGSGKVKPRDISMFLGNLEGSPGSGGLSGAVRSDPDALNSRRGVDSLSEIRGGSIGGTSISGIRGSSRGGTSISGIRGSSRGGDSIFGIRGSSRGDTSIPSTRSTGSVPRRTGNNIVPSSSHKKHKPSVAKWVGSLIGQLAQSATKSRSSVLSTLSWMKGATSLLPYLPVLAKVLNNDSKSLPQTLLVLSHAIPRQRLLELQTAIVETLSSSEGQNWLFGQLRLLVDSEIDTLPTQLNLNVSHLEDYSSFVTAPDEPSMGLDPAVGSAEAPREGSESGSQLADIVNLARTPLGRTTLAQLGNFIRMINVDRVIDSLTQMASAQKNLTLGSGGESASGRGGVDRGGDIIRNIGRGDLGGSSGFLSSQSRSHSLSNHSSTSHPLLRSAVDQLSSISSASANHTGTIGDHLKTLVGHIKSMTEGQSIRPSRNVSISSSRRRGAKVSSTKAVSSWQQPSAAQGLLSSLSMVQQWLRQAASGRLDFRQALDGAMDSEHVTALLHMLAGLVSSGGAGASSGGAMTGLIDNLSDRADAGDERGVANALESVMKNRVLRSYLHRLADQANTLRGNNVALNVSSMGPILTRYYREHSQQGAGESSTGTGSGASDGAEKMLDMSRTWVINTAEYNGDSRNGKSLTNVKFVENWRGSGFNDLGQVTAVSLTSDQRRLVVFHRADRTWTGASFDNRHRLRDQTEPIAGATIVYMDAETGHKLLELGSNFFHMPHGLAIDNQDNIWCTDVGMHQVFKFGPDGGSGIPLLTIGERFVPGSDDTHLCKPTAVAVQSDGTVFVADGYCNARVLKLAHDGRVLATLGRQTSTFAMFGSVLGMRPAVDRFNIPHALALSEHLSLLCVADRENGRVSCFNSQSLEPAGAYTVGWINSRIFSVAIVANASSAGGIGGVAGDGGTPPPPPAHLYVVNGPNYIGNKVQGFIVDLATGSVLSTFSPGGRGLSNPHDIAVTSDGGSIYVAELSPSKVWKFISGLSGGKSRASPLSDKQTVRGSGWNSVFVVLVVVAPLIIVGTIIYRRFCYNGERGLFFSGNILRGQLWSGDSTVKDRSGFAPLNSTDADFDESDSDVEEFTSPRLNPRV